MESDAELIARSLSGDGDAFVEMISRHETAVGGYLARRAGREMAEDLLGEVWIAAYESRGSYDRAFPDARPWLLGVALNRLRRYWRTRPAEHLVLDPAGLAGLAGSWDPWPAVDGRVAMAAALRPALARLRPQEREVLTLVAWEDLTVAEAARVLDIPAGTARRLLYQARQALRESPAMVALLADRNTVKEST
jgi:DNA-directed RNA polymerase specialized sigma24 family protein